MSFAYGLRVCGSFVSSCSFGVVLLSLVIVGLLSLFNESLYPSPPSFSLRCLNVPLESEQCYCYGLSLPYIVLSPFIYYISDSSYIIRSSSPPLLFPDFCSVAPTPPSHYRHLSRFHPTYFTHSYIYRQHNNNIPAHIRFIQNYVLTPFLFLFSLLFFFGSRFSLLMLPSRPLSSLLSNLSSPILHFLLSSSYREPPSYLLSLFLQHLFLFPFF